MRIGWMIAGVLGLAACSSESTRPTATTTGEGPCTTSAEDACNACVARGAAECEADQCSSSAAALGECVTAMSAITGCTDAAGNPSSECCRVEEDALQRCLDACPAMQRCR